MAELSVFKLGQTLLPFRSYGNSIFFILNCPIVNKICAAIDNFFQKNTEIFGRKNHSLGINCTSRNNQGPFATGNIRRNIKFVAFLCVFLTKIMVDPESW